MQQTGLCCSEVPLLPLLFLLQQTQISTQMVTEYH